MADETKTPENNANPGAAKPDAAKAANTAPETPADPAAQAGTEIDKLEAEKADLTDRLLRAHAEIENLRKRAEREKEETARYAISKFARDIVAVSDNFERAIQSVPADAATDDGPLKSLLEGVSMTERELLNVLERHGIKRISPKGEAFNPHLHQAMMEVQNPDIPSGTITEVYQPGYVIEDRVLRPAMVVVAKGGAKPGKAADEAGAPPAAQPAATAPQDPTAEPTSTAANENEAPTPDEGGATANPSPEQNGSNS